jgi:phosphopantothenoylcysteine decarboxylase/phosphopantothenate--cysteine ligase
MARILITSGPTRQYLDPVRYLSNASSGRMGKALAEAAIAAGHQPLIVTGPVDVKYPKHADVIQVVSTEEMFEACMRVFPGCDGMIAAAAPCDYRPKAVASEKIRKTGRPLEIELVETPDIVARLGKIRQNQWMVAFALETEDQHLRAMQKLEKKNCDLIVVNGPAAINAAATRVEVLDSTGTVIVAISGSKRIVAKTIIRAVEERLMRRLLEGQKISRGDAETRREC